MRFCRRQTSAAQSGSMPRHLRQCWGMRRVRPHAPYRTKYEWGYVATALEIAGQHEAVCVFFPGVSHEISTLFLEQISATDPAACHIVIQDRAGFHLAAGAPELPANVTLLPLPAYSPNSTRSNAWAPSSARRRPIGSSPTWPPWRPRLPRPCAHSGRTRNGFTNSWARTV